MEKLQNFSNYCTITHYHRRTSYKIKYSQKLAFTISFLPILDIPFVGIIYADLNNSFDPEDSQSLI